MLMGKLFVKIVSSDEDYNNSRLNFNVLNRGILSNNITVFVKGYQPPYLLT
jgi:hypothetical protein